MQKVLWQVQHHEIELFLIHSLNYEFPIMRKEEKAAGFSLWFTSFEDRFVVGLGWKRIKNLFVVDAVKLSDLLEDAVGKVGDSHFFVDHLFLILKLSWFFLAETWQCSWWELAKKACGAFGTFLMTSFWKIEFIGTFWHKLVVFCYIPISCVIDSYFIDLHASNMLKFINVLVIFDLLWNFLWCSFIFRVSLDHLDIRKVLLLRISD